MLISAAVRVERLMAASEINGMSNRQENVGLIFDNTIQKTQ